MKDGRRVNSKVREEEEEEAGEGKGRGILGASPSFLEKEKRKKNGAPPNIEQNPSDVWIFIF